MHLPSLSGRSYMNYPSAKVKIMSVIFHFHKKRSQLTSLTDIWNMNISVIQSHQNKELGTLALISNTWTLRRRLQVRCTFSICSLLSNRELLTLSLLDCTDMICIGEKCELQPNSISSNHYFDSNTFNKVGTLRLPFQEAVPCLSPSLKCCSSSCSKSKH